MTTPAHDYLSVEHDGNVALVWLDQPQSRVNTLSEAAIEAFSALIDRLESDLATDAVVLISRKPDSFIVGADLGMIQGFDAVEDVERVSRTGQALLSRLAAMPKPVVAAIHGPAMGGGLEVALACHYRMATESPKTKLALPEVMLGLLPGAGGTQRLPRLVGIQEALGMMLTGRTIYPRKAKRMGLVDALVPPALLREAAVKAARGLADGSLRRREHDGGLQERLLEGNAAGRRLIYSQARERVMKQTKGNYPAPLAILEAVRIGMDKGMEAGLDAEARGFARLVLTPESRNLVRIFFAKQAAEKNPYRDDARDVDTVAVLGAGLMGAGIGEVSAQRGLNVLLKDMDLERAAAGKRLVWKSMQKRVAKRAMTPFERDRIVERVVPLADYDALAAADVVIEAVPEDLKIKHAVLEDVEAVTRPTCVFASNTSSIPITDIARGSSRPETVLGMHYFSPVPQMPLLEIIRTDQTADWALATAFDVGLRQGKTVIVVNDGPGFYTTRILAVYMNEALLMLEEGADPAEVDRAMERFGFPMGPYTLFDLVGIPTGAKITEVMGHYLKDRDLPMSQAAKALAAAGLTGQNGRGFYRYEEKDGRTKKAGQNFGEAREAAGAAPLRAVDETEIQQRLALTMVNEAVRCLEEGILLSPTDGDLGAVFGLGFPPFLGGPFRYIDAEGASAVAIQLGRLKVAHGPRFEPAALLREKAADNTPFHAA